MASIANTAAVVSAAVEKAKQIKDNTAPTSANAVSAQQQRTTATQNPPATPANSGMQAAVDAVNAAASPTKPAQTNQPEWVSNAAGTLAKGMGVVRTAVDKSKEALAKNQAQQAQQTQQSGGVADVGKNLKIDTKNFDANATLQNINGMLTQLLNAQTQQQNAQIDYATQKGVNDLQRAEEDAQPQFQTQRNQIALDEAKALDNAALYAEARGDRGGIGQTQYTLIQLNAAKNKLAVNQAQTKLSTDTMRQIADLRAQGEFSKADAVLELTQNYLSSLMSSYQWAVQLGLDYDQYQQELVQWQKNYDMSYAQLTGKLPDGSKTLAYQQYEQEQKYQKDQDNEKKLSDIGSALLSVGVMPSAEQLAAMGLSKAQAKDYITAQGLTLYDSAGKSSSGSGSGSGGGSGSSSSNSSKKKSSSTNSTAKTSDTSTAKDVGKTATQQYVGNGKTQSSITSVNYSQDEGVIVWNGKSYTKTNDFINAVNLANRRGTITDAQAKTIQSNMNKYLPAGSKI